MDPDLVSRDLAAGGNAEVALLGSGQPMGAAHPDITWRARGHPSVPAALESVPIVVVASATWASPLPVSVHQICERLAAYGNPVLFVESTGLRVPVPLQSSRDLERVVRRLGDVFRGVRQVRDRLFVCSPVALPGAHNELVRRLSLRALSWQICRVARRIGFDRPILWGFLPTAVCAVQDLSPRLVVYQCVDHYAANPGVDPAWVDEIERRMLAAADLVIATSAALAARLRKRRSDTHLIRNVADVELFARAAHEDLVEPKALRSIARPRAVYLGNLARYRIDLAWIEGLARAIPELEILLIGTVGLGEIGGIGLRDLPNVHRLGPYPPSELPAFLKASEVALIPFLDNDHTRSSSPLKLWEYIAAGLPVVARDLPALRTAADEVAGICLARDLEGFVAGVREALGESPEARIARSAAAASHGWESRMTELHALLHAALEAT